MAQRDHDTETTVRHKDDGGQAHVSDNAGTAALSPASKASPTRRRSSGSAATVSTTQKPATGRARPARAKARGAAATAGGFGKAAMLGIAAAGVAAGLAANLGRKVVVQAPGIAAGDWLEALKREHEAALALITALQNTTVKQKAKRTVLLTQLKHALSKHALAEENVIYPALRVWGDTADADKLNHDHGYVKQYLYELGNMADAAAGFLPKVADFRAALETHIREEEDAIFPKLHAALDEATNKKLTAQTNREGFKLA